MYHPKLVLACMQVLPPGRSGGAASTGTLRLQAHLQVGAQVLRNVVAGDFDHDFAPLGLPHIHQAVGVAGLSNLNVGVSRPGAGRAYLASPPYCSSTAWASLTLVTYMHSKVTTVRGGPQSWLIQHAGPCGPTVPAAYACMTVQITWSDDTQVQNGLAGASLSG